MTRLICSILAAGSAAFSMSSPARADPFRAERGPVAIARRYDGDGFRGRHIERARAERLRELRVERQRFYSFRHTRAECARFERWYARRCDQLRFYRG